jgi:hypothetical protein
MPDRTHIDNQVQINVILDFRRDPCNAEGFWVFHRWTVLLLLTTFRGPWSASSLETSSTITVPFPAEKPPETFSIPSTDKFTLEQVMKAEGGSRDTLHSFSASELDGGICLTSRPGLFTPGKEPRYPLSRRLWGPHSPSGRFGEQEYFLAGTEIWIPGRPARSVVAILYRLRYSGT